MGYEFVEVEFVGGYVVVGCHDAVGYGLLAVYDVVELRVDGVLSDEVVACDVVFLADAVGAVLALAAVGVCLGELDECDVG